MSGYWIRSGTVAVASGSASVVGTGTTWQTLNVQPGYEFVGPDGKGYEILSVDSETALTLTTAYGGATASGAAYIVKIQAFAAVADIKNRVIDLLNAWKTSVALPGSLKVGGPSWAGSVAAFKGAIGSIENSGSVAWHIIKAALTDTASLKFFTGTSLRAKMGTDAADNLSVTVSADGLTEVEAANINKATGNVHVKKALVLDNAATPATLLNGMIWKDPSTGRGYIRENGVTSPISAAAQTVGTVIASNVTGLSDAIASAVGGLAPTQARRDAGEAARRLLKVSPGAGVAYSVADFVSLGYAASDGSTEIGDTIANVAAMVMGQSVGRHKYNNKATWEAVAANTFSSEFDALGNAVGQAVFAARKNMVGYPLPGVGLSGWNFYGTATVTPNYSLAPDGTMTATRVVVSSGGLTIRIFTDAISSTPYSGSIFCKSNASPVSGMNLNVGVTNLVSFSATASWDRYGGSATPSNLAYNFVDIQLPAGADVLLWCVQLELGTIVTSPIPVYANVPADTIYAYPSGFTLNDEITFGGTFICPPARTSDQVIAGIYSDTPVTNYIYAYIVQSDGRMSVLVVNSGYSPNIVLTTSAPLTPGKSYKWGLSISKSRVKARMRVRCDDGTLFDVSANLSVPSLVAVSKMIGQWFGGSQLNSYIKEDITYGRALSDPEIVEFVP